MGHAAFGCTPYTQDRSAAHAWHPTRYVTPLQCIHSRTVSKGLSHGTTKGCFCTEIMRERTSCRAVLRMPPALVFSSSTNIAHVCFGHELHVCNGISFGSSPGSNNCVPNCFERPLWWHCVGRKVDHVKQAPCRFTASLVYLKRDEEHGMGPTSCSLHANLNL